MAQARASSAVPKMCLNDTNQFIVLSRPDCDSLDTCVRRRRAVFRPRPASIVPGGRTQREEPVAKTGLQPFVWCDDEGDGYNGPSKGERQLNVTNIPSEGIGILIRHHLRLEERLALVQRREGDTQLQWIVWVDGNRSVVVVDPKSGADEPPVDLVVSLQQSDE